MAYNALSGTVLAPQQFIPGDLVSGNIISGNLSTSDGSSLINIPRVYNAADNAIITNVGGDANVLNAEANLTFDGSTLSLTGDLTASIGISASYLEGDGSKLTNVSSSASDSSDGGIFTEINASQAYTTSSLNIGSSATPTAPLSVIGISFLSGGLVHKRVAVTSNHTISTSEYYLGVDSTGGAIKLTLPSAATATNGQTWVVKDEGGVSGTKNITVSGSNADTIDGQTTAVLQSPYASITLYCNGVTKFFIS